jgi:oxygen-dependent protoporphyrinogen oxidase
MKAETTDVAVVGGGISGLAAAYGLARAGVAFTLLESAPRWGGRILTERSGGFLLEGGPDSLFAQKTAAFDLCRELGIEHRLIPAREPRTVYVMKRGRLHELPPGMAAGAPQDMPAFLRSGLFSWPGKLRMGLEPLVPRRRDGVDESIAGFFRRRLGREALTLLGDPLLAGIHAGDPERLSLGTTMPRLAELEKRAGSLARGLARARSASAPGPMFYTLQDGLHELVEALVRTLPAGRLRAGTGVHALFRDGRGYRLQLDDGGVVRAGRVVLAVPAPIGSRLLGSLDLDAAAWLLSVPFAPTATVLLGYRREDVGHALDGHGLLVPRGEGLRTTACSFVSSKFGHRAPEGHVLLRAFIGGARDASALSLGKVGLLDTVRRELTPVLGLRGEPVVTRVFTWPESMPQMEVGHRERMAALEHRLEDWPGLHVIGAGLRGTGIADAVTDGLQATRSAGDLPRRAPMAETADQEVPAGSVR